MYASMWFCFGRADDFFIFGKRALKDYSRAKKFLLILFAFGFYCGIMNV